MIQSVRALLLRAALVAVAALAVAEHTRALEAEGGWAACVGDLDTSVALTDICLEGVDLCLADLARPEACACWAPEP